MSKKSKTLIALSLTELLGKTSYTDITISAICENTTVVRKTFYNNFTSKDEIIKFICTEKLDKLIELQLKPIENPSYRDFLTVFFHFAQSEGAFLKVLVKNDLFHIAQKALAAKLPEVSPMLPGNIYEKESPEFLGYVLDFTSGGLIALLEKWIISDFAMKSDEVIDIYLSLIKDPQNA